MIQVSIPDDVRKKDYSYNAEVELVNPVVGTVARANYREADVVNLGSLKHIRVADMSKGKANDDGYRGVHIYFQLDNFHYPIEIQYNTYYDRQLNNWLHKYLYKKGYDNEIGCCLRTAYENGIIKTEQEFKGVLHNVLLDSKKV